MSSSLLKGGGEPAAKEFYEFLQSPEADAVYTKAAVLALRRGLPPP